MSEPWTPGPWKADEGYELVDCDGDHGQYEVRPFVFADDGADLPPVPVTTADARLIAAAPEMAALLERMTGPKHQVAQTADGHAWFLEANALLSRIRGGA